jgi:hypothetical protein
MSKWGFARAAQALAPRVAQSFYKMGRSTQKLTTGRIQYSMFQAIAMVMA